MTPNKLDVQKSVDNTWSDYCSLDYWITDMCQKDTMPNKQVLKMAMKHIKDTLYEAHRVLCDFQEED